MRNRLATALVVVSLVLLAAALLYVFGTPTSAPDAGQVSASGAHATAPVPENGEQSDGAPPMGEVVEGEVPAPDPSTPLAIEIPGCTCHSDDPDVVAEHEQYRMNQCAGCHVGGPTAGG
jgi:hypothetical protein